MSNYKPDPKGYANLERALAFGLLNCALAVEAGAKQRVPYRTGNLRRSIHTAAFHKGKKIFGNADRAEPNYPMANGAVAMAVVGTNTGYGVYVELGTIHMHAQPYLGPALADVRPNAGALVKAGMAAKLTSGT